MKVIRIPESDAPQFDATIAKIVADAPGPVAVVFFGTELPDTQKSFCPDCYIADPLIRKAILASPAAGTTTLVEVPVGNRDLWRNPANPYRTHPKIMLARIPTLTLWTAEGPTTSLVEEECASMENLAKF
ncbi:hypothetical protein BC828DRAFT_340207, partial [Blastocladiella britannica]